MDRRQALIAMGGLAASCAGAGIFGQVGPDLWRDLSFDPSTLPLGYRPQIMSVGQFIVASRPHDTTYIPPGLRQLNTDGSCVHLSTRNHLRALGLYEAAEDWEYAHGEYSGRHVSRMEAAGLRFCVETNGDERFLDWACGNSGGCCRGAGITLLAAHMVNLLDLDPASYAQPKGYVLNNWGSGEHRFDARQAIEYQRSFLIRDWRARGGWAFAVISDRHGNGAPYPPIPYNPPDSPYQG